MRNMYKDTDIEALLLQDYGPHEDYRPFNESKYLTLEEYEGCDIWVNRLPTYPWPNGRYMTFNQALSL